ncbi:MAG: hypothetical protein CM15mP117_05740 [Alphaproteobacteria bacterium]|nr:MAG: hypothetical protein CM15mP117_05740 [Alphaproteobacteria bacterium]
MAIPEQAKRLTIGEARIINHGENLAILSIGTMLETCKEVITILAKNRGVNATLVDARFAKPLDTKMINKLCTLIRPCLLWKRVHQEGLQHRSFNIL